MEDTRRIVPVIDVELKKKIEKADIVSKDKKEGIKKPRVSQPFRFYVIDSNIRFVTVSLQNSFVFR